MAWAEQLIIDEFHKLYYEGMETGGRLYEQTSWFGVTCLKCPLDMWVYQEMLHQLKPDLIIETGTYHGGSALYLAHLCDALGHGHIATIDVLDLPRPAHPRVTYLKGSSTDPAIAKAARACAPESAKILVILDSDHREAHVLDELRLYAPMVSEGSYLVVEDTNVNGHPARPEFGSGPYEAVTKFIAECADFIPDRDKEKFLLTFNPRGYLKKLSALDARPDIVDAPCATEAMPDLVEALRVTHQRDVDRLIAEANQARSAAAEVEAALTDQLAQRTTELSQRTGELSQRTDELNQRTDELAQRTVELTQQTDQLTQRSCELTQVQAELEHVKADLHRLRSHWLVKPALKLRRTLLGNRQ